MNYKEILTIASNEVLNLKNRTVNVIDLIKPANVAIEQNLFSK